VIQRLQLAPVLQQRSRRFCPKGFAAGSDWHRRSCTIGRADPGRPTDGLDPNRSTRCATLINEISRDKIIGDFDPHLGGGDAVCTRAMVIARGRLVATTRQRGWPARSRYHNAVSLQLERPEQLAAAREAVAGLPTVATVEVDERSAS